MTQVNCNRLARAIAAALLNRVAANCPRPSSLMPGGSH